MNVAGFLHWGSGRRRLSAPWSVLGRDLRGSPFAVHASVMHIRQGRLEARGLAGTCTGGRSFMPRPPPVILTMTCGAMASCIRRCVPRKPAAVCGGNRFLLNAGYHEYGSVTSSNLDSNPRPHVVGRRPRHVCRRVCCRLVLDEQCTLAEWLDPSPRQLCEPASDSRRGARH